MGAIISQACTVYTADCTGLYRDILYTRQIHTPSGWGGTLLRKFEVLKKGVVLSNEKPFFQIVSVLLTPISAN